MSTEVFVPADDMEDDGAPARGTTYTGTSDEQAARDAMVAAATKAVVEDRESPVEEDGEVEGNALTPREKGEVKPWSSDEALKEDIARRQAGKKPGVLPDPLEQPKKNGKTPTPLSELSKVLEAREERRQVSGKAAETLRAAEQAKSRLDALMGEVSTRAQQMAQREAEINQLFQMARQNPTEFIRRVGLNPDQFIDATLNEKDPNYQRHVAMQNALAQRDAQIAQLTGAVQQLLAKAQGYDQQTQQAQAQAEVQQLFDAIPEDSPVWRECEDQEDVLYQANKARRAYKEKTGRLASGKEIGEYLHYRALKKGGLLAPRENSGSGATRRPGKGKANGTRALGGDDASQRSGGPARKTINEMSSDEEKDYLVQVAEAAIMRDG